jgi:ferredoxin
MKDVKNIATFTVVVMPAGQTFAASAEQTLLQSVEQATNLELLIDSSCRNGTCRTCICQLLKGQVAYRIAWPGLSIDEKRDGFVLPCVAYPLSNVVIQLPV